MTFDIRPYQPADKPAPADPAQRRYTRQLETDRDALLRFDEIMQPRGNNVKLKTLVFSDEAPPPGSSVILTGIVPLWMAA